jgi:AcrR family transcriptional regulator
MSVREQGKTQRRDEILAAARALMRESGGLGFSMRTLAEQAGVSIATPYNLFGSKQAILLALLDADLADYETALGALHADGVEVLFEAVSLMTSLLARDPEFYRNVLAAVCRDGGPELRHMVSGPRYVLWKRLLRQATAAGHLRGDVDPDAFAITLTQLMFSSVQDWAQGSLGAQEMEARIRYGLALTLLAVATEQSRDLLTHRMRSAEARLQQLWQGALQDRLRLGPLDEDTRELLADQLKHVDTELPQEEIA